MSTSVMSELVANGRLGQGVPGTLHDKKLSDVLQTLERVLDGCELDADKGYQGLADQVALVTVRDAETGAEQSVPRVLVQIPVKKPRGKN